MLANDSGCGKEVQFEISMRVEDVVVGAFQITVISLLWDLRYTSLCFRAFAFLYEADVCIILGI